MKKATIAATLFALLCWAYPINVLAQIAEQPQLNTETKIEEVKEQNNEPSTERQNQEPSGKLVESKNKGNTKTNSAGSYNGRHYSKEEVI